MKKIVPLITLLAMIIAIITTATKIRAQERVNNDIRLKETAIPQ